MFSAQAATHVERLLWPARSAPALNASSYLRRLSKLFLSGKFPPTCLRPTGPPQGYRCYNNFPAAGSYSSSEWTLKLARCSYRLLKVLSSLLSSGPWCADKACFLLNILGGSTASKVRSSALLSCGSNMTGRHSAYLRFFCRSAVPNGRLLEDAVPLRPNTVAEENNMIIYINSNFFVHFTLP